MLWFQALLRPCPSHKKVLRTHRFPFDYKDKKNFLASPQQKTPWPVFQDGRCNTSPIPLILQRYHWFFQKNSFLKCHIWLSLSGFRFFSPPYRGTFQLSLTVLLHYRSWDVFRIRSWCLPHSNPISNGSYSRTKSKNLTKKNISTGLSPSTVVKFQIHFNLSCKAPTTKTIHHIFTNTLLYGIQFVLSRFHSPLLTTSQLLSFPPPTKMFQFSGFPILNGITLTKKRVRKSHSAILGSKDVCSSPKLIAAYHDLHRQLKPSHPPDSISSNIFTKLR